MEKTQHLFTLELAQALGFETCNGYYEYIIESFNNGQKEQAKELYKALPGNYGKKFLENYWNDMSKEVILFFIF